MKRTYFAGRHAAGHLKGDRRHTSTRGSRPFPFGPLRPATRHLLRECTALAVVCIFLNTTEVLPLSRAWAAAVPEAPGGWHAPSLSSGAHVPTSTPIVNSAKGHVGRFILTGASAGFGGDNAAAESGPVAAAAAGAGGGAHNCDAPVTLAPLDLTRIPSESELRAKGGLSGPLATLGNADELNYKGRLAQAFGFDSLQSFDTVSTAAFNGALPPNRALLGTFQQLAEAHRRVLRLEAINLDFGRAIQARSENNWDLAYKLFSQHLQKYPDSPWAGEAMLHLAIDDASNGRYAQAQARYAALLAISSDDPADPTYEIRQKAKNGWINLDLKTGQWSDAIGKIQEVLQTDGNNMRRTWSSSWLLRAHRNAEIHDAQMLACGTQALGAMLAEEHHDRAAAKVRGTLPPNANGFTLQELAALSGRYGVRLRGFRVGEAGLRYEDVPGGKPAVPSAGKDVPYARELELARLPLPLIVHYDFARMQGASFGLRRGAAQWAASANFSPSAPSQNVQSASAGAMNMSGMQMPEMAGMQKTPAKGSAGVSGTAASTMAGMVMAPVHPLAPGKVSAFRVHNVGHFVVLTAIDLKKQMVTISDPLRAAPVHLSFAEFESEWSGAGLVYDHALPAAEAQPVDLLGTKPGTPRLHLASLEWLSPSEMSGISGACCCPWQPNGPLGPAYLGPPAEPQASPCGSPVWTVDPSSMNLYMKDIPLWYHPAYGPDFDLTLSYNSQDADYYGLYYGGPFGQRWRLNFGAKLMEAPGGTVNVTEWSGKIDSYNLNAAGTGYISPVGIYNTLTQTGANSFQTTEPTGEIKVYGTPLGTNNLPLSVNACYLNQFADRFGNAVTVRYETLSVVQSETVGGTTVNTTTVLVLPVQVTDATGGITTFSYNSAGLCTCVSAQNGTSAQRQALFAYDANNNLIRAVDMGGNVVTYTYDTSSILTGVGTPQGNWGFNLKYPGHNAGDDTFSYQTFVTNPALGVDQYLLLGHSGEYTSHFDPDNNETRYYCSDSVQGVPVVTWIAGVHANGTLDQTTLTYDHASGQISSITDPDGHTTSWTYNFLGRLLTATDAKGYTTTLNYATNGVDALYATNALGRETLSAVYNSYHQPTTIIQDPETAEQTDGLNLTTTNTYETWGPIATTENPNSETTTYNYDPSTKLLTSITQGSSTLASYAYDLHNRVSTYTDSYGQAVSYQYTDLDHAKKITYSDGSQVTTDYACCSLPGVVTDRQGRKTYYDYDNLKRLIRVQDADGNTVQYNRDAAEQIVGLIDSRGNQTHWDYDTEGHVVRKTFLDGTTQTYGYDPAGHLISSTDARGLTTSYSYDADSNPLQITYPTLTATAWQYDALDRPTQMTDQSGTTTWGYDNLSRVTSENGPYTNDAVGYTYDNLSRRSTLTINATDTVTSTYDSLDRLSTVTAPSSSGTTTGDWAWTYAPGSGNSALPSKLVLPTAAETTYSYDGFERLTSLQNLKSDDVTVLSSYAYGFDNTDKITALTSLTRQIRDNTNTLNAAQAITYTYENGFAGTDQLTHEKSGETTPLLDKAYAYDPMGNRTQVIDKSGGGGTNGNGNVTAFNANALNQQTSTTTTYSNNTTATDYLTYDVRGNTSRSQVTSSTKYALYYFDDAGRLSQVLWQWAAGQPNQYQNINRSLFYYDGLGRRRRDLEQTYNISTSTWSTTTDTDYVYDGMNVLQERDNTKTGQPVENEYVWAGGTGGLLSRTVYNTATPPAPVASYYYHYDGRGNVVQLTDSSQNVQAFYNYDSYGNVTGSGGGQVAQPFGFSTKWLHAQTGFLDYGFRFYSPGLGTWISRDPIDENGGSNLYEYVGNDPNDFSDDLGTIPIDSSVLQQPRSSFPWNWFDPAPNPSPDTASPGSNPASVAAMAKGGHSKGARPSTEEKHQRAEGRRQREQERSGERKRQEQNKKKNPPTQDPGGLRKRQPAPETPPCPDDGPTIPWWDRIFPETDPDNPWPVLPPIFRLPVPEY